MSFTAVRMPEFDNGTHAKNNLVDQAVTYIVAQPDAH